MTYLARRDIIPFYRCKGPIYNAWFMDKSIPYLRAKLVLVGSRTTLHWNTQMFVGPRRRARSTMVATWLHGGRVM
jgi:hypothetical protein